MVELKQILIFLGKFLSLPLHFRPVIIMSDIENGKGEGAVFIPCRTGLGWMADHWLSCKCEELPTTYHSAATITATGGQQLTIAKTPICTRKHQVKVILNVVELSHNLTRMVQCILCTKK